MEWGNTSDTDFKCQLNTPNHSNTTTKWHRTHLFEDANSRKNIYLILTPHIVPHQEDCVVMNSNAGQSIGKWLIKSCNETYGFVCTRKVGQFLLCVFVSKRTKWKKQFVWQPFSFFQNTSFFQTLISLLSQTHMFPRSMYPWEMTASRLWLRISPGMTPRRTARLIKPAWPLWEMNGRRLTLNFWFWISKLLFGLDWTKNRYQVFKLINLYCCYCR